MANSKRDVKLTLADLIAKKAAKEAREIRSEDMYVNSLEGNITVQNPGKDIIYKSIDMDRETTADAMYANAFLIYHAVSMFREPELLLTYEIKDNVSIVGKLLEPYEIKEVADKVFELGGFSKPDEIEDDLKN